MLSARETDFRLDGKVALITGAGRGIGLAIAQALAAHGCSVAIQDLDQDIARREADALCQQGIRAIALDGDITDLSLPPRLIERTVGELGGLHILVNNAAVQMSKTWTDFTVDDMQWMIRGDFIAPVRLCQLAAPIFSANKWGRILNLGSGQQRGGWVGMLPYAMCKSAMVNLTRSLARTLAPDGITVNLIAPGYFNTHRNRAELGTAQQQEQAGKWVPMGRIGQPADCAGIALMLCSDAAAYITGQTIYVDGGITSR